MTGPINLTGYRQPDPWDGLRDLSEVDHGFLDSEPRRRICPTEADAIIIRCRFIKILIGSACRGGDTAMALSRAAADYIHE